MCPRVNLFVHGGMVAAEPCKQTVHQDCVCCQNATSCPLSQIWGITSMQQPYLHCAGKEARCWASKLVYASIASDMHTQLEINSTYAANPRLDSRHRNLCYLHLMVAQKDNGGALSIGVAPLPVQGSVCASLLSDHCAQASYAAADAHTCCLTSPALIFKMITIMICCLQVLRPMWPTATC